MNNERKVGEKMSERPHTMRCAVCDGEAYGRQWRNRDTGFGVCVRCADANTAQYGEGSPADGLGSDTTYSLYGVRGVHFDVGGES